MNMYCSVRLEQVQRREREREGECSYNSNYYLLILFTYSIGYGKLASEAASVRWQLTAATKSQCGQQFHSPASTARCESAQRHG